MSQYNPTTPKRKKSYAKLFEVSAIWAIVALVVGWLVFKEISKKTLEIEKEKAGRQLIIEAENLYGIVLRSPLICQGLTIGKVTEIEANPSVENPEKLEITIYAQLDARFSNWKFAPEASVDQGSVMGGLTGSPITLSFAGRGLDPLPGELTTKPQYISLEAPEDMGARLRALLSEAETVVGAFTEEVPAPEGWPEGKTATRIDLLTANLTSASESLSGASKSFEMQMDASIEESMMAGMKGVQLDLKDFTAGSNELIGEISQIVTSIETRFDDVLGASTEERSRMRIEAEEVLTSLDSLIDKLDDLASRTGDTFLGRRLIRKPDKETEPSDSDAVLESRGGPRK